MGYAVDDSRIGNPPDEIPADCAGKKRRRTITPDFLLNDTGSTPVSPLIGSVSLARVAKLPLLIDP